MDILRLFNISSGLHVSVWSTAVSAADMKVPARTPLLDVSAGSLILINSPQRNRGVALTHTVVSIGKFYYPLLRESKAEKEQSGTCTSTRALLIPHIT